MIANDRNRVRCFVLGLKKDGACIDLYENHSENSLTGDLSNDTTVNPPLFSLVNTFKLSNIGISVIFDLLLGSDFARLSSIYVIYGSDFARLSSIYVIDGSDFARLSSSYVIDYA